MSWYILSQLDRRERFRYVTTIIILALSSFLIYIIIADISFQVLILIGIGGFTYLFSGRLFDRLNAYQIEQQVKKEKSKKVNIDISNCPSCLKIIPDGELKCLNCGFEIEKYKN